MLRPHREVGRRNPALRGFKRLMLYLFAAAMFMVGAALAYLSSTGALTPTLVITVAIGVFVSIMLGGGLMAAGFFSADSGYDAAVARSATQELSDTLEPED
jgi:Na+-transporting methylmalonyl-CoA/oxaloacetate decarboxylase beta subunit